MRIFNVLFLLLLAYIIAALAFWGFSLHRQSEQIYQQQELHLRSMVDSFSHPGEYHRELEKLEQTRITRKKQYLGEGFTFLLVIFIGAAVVYSSFRRSIRLSRQQTNFMLSVTHELKSPIAAIKLNLQTLERHRLDEEKRNLLTAKCIKEANRLNDLCNNMLLASQMEGRQYKSIREKLNFTELVESTLRDFLQRYPHRLELHLDKEEEWMTGDRLMLQMAVSNLVENAVKYTPEEKPIRISLSSKNKTACLQVTDEGTGVPDNEKEKIFKKFYRVGNENTRKSKGTGLGLYLVQKIARQHRGKIIVKDNVPQGSVFELTLPLTG